MAPTIAAGLIDASGFDGMLGVLAATAIINAFLSVALFVMLRPISNPAPPIETRNRPATHPR